MVYVFQFSSDHLIINNKKNCLHFQATFRILWERSFEYEPGTPIKLWFGPRAIVFLTDPRDIEVRFRELIRAQFLALYC